MRRFKVLLSLFYFVSPVSGESGSTFSPLSLDSVLDRVEDLNPEVRAARQSWLVSQELVGPAKTWSNPTFTYVDERVPSGADGSSAERIRHYRLEQSIPFPGKLSTEAQMKWHEALTAKTNFQAKLIEVRAEARMRFYGLYLADQKIRMAERNLEALRGVLKAAQARLASNQSSTSDVFMAQLELRKMENELFQQRQARTLAEIELNTLLNQPTETAWEAVEPPVLSDLPMSVTEFKNVAKANAPQYRAAQHEINHALSMRKRSRFDYAPDFNVMYERETSAGEPSGRQLGVGVSFPLWITRPMALNRSAEAHLIETRSMSEGAANMVLKMVHTEVTEVTTHLTLARSYERDVLPTAQRNLRLAQDQYASGHGDFVRILEAYRSWIEANNQYQDELYHYAEHWGLLERWVGVEISKLTSRPQQPNMTQQENNNAKP